MIFKHDHGSYDVLGDTTEGTLLLLAAQKGLLAEQVKKDGSLLEEFAFDPTLKMMTVVWESNQQKTIYTKGAPESVLKSCALDEQSRQNIENEFREYAKEGLRVIALAYKNVTRTPKTRQEAEQDLIFIGFVGI
ncbi:MAG: ATPase, P-type (Transporting), HAD superfamily, subfamily IC [Candidatus Amesbacteria bacterium GW2011_GWB1_47_26]|nr:MAG: ATPase, P-type (Transporting), HAD superfamily, subfamily IC [Candidatus Amesbacteria bacterium GW2011_GWB1_47_26]